MGLASDEPDIRAEAAAWIAGNGYRRRHPAAASIA